MRTHRAKIVQLNLNGVVASIVDAPIAEDGLGSKRKALEKDAWLYRYSDLSVTLINFDPEHFRGYTSRTQAFFLWLEKSDDGIAWATDFFGYIHPKAIKVLKPSLNTNITALSIDKLFEVSPQIISRGVYRAVISQPVNQFGTVAANAPVSGHGYIKDAVFPDFTPGVSYSFYEQTAILSLVMPDNTETYRYHRAGSVVNFTASRSVSGASLNVSTIITENVEPADPQSTLPTDNFFSPVDFYKLGNVVYPVGHPEGYEHDYESRVIRIEGLGSGSENPLKYVYIKDLVLARNIRDRYDREGNYAGWLDAFVKKPEPNPFSIHEVWRFPIEKALHGFYQDSNGDTVECVRVEIAIGNREWGLDIDEKDFVNAKYTLTVATPSEPTDPTSCLIYSNQMYGIGGDNVLPFPGSSLLQGLCQRVPFFNRLNPQIVWHGTPRTIDRRVILSPEPATALSEMQKAMDVLISFDFGEVQPNGLPRAVLNVYTRQFLAEQGKVTIKTPITWDEEPSGYLPVVVITGPGPINMYGASGQSVAWYSEDEDGVPNYTSYATEIPSGTAHVQLAIDKIALETFSFHDGEIKDYYYNDAVLRAVAKGVYLFYGRFYRQISVTVYDPDLQLPDLVGRLITEPSQQKEGIVMEQEVDYRSRQVTLGVLMDTADTI